MNMAQRQPKVQQVNIRKPRSPPEGQFCSYSHRTCTHNKIPGYEFCSRHILEDKNAPFKQCEFNSSKSGKKCINAATKSDKKGSHRYCICPLQLLSYWWYNILWKMLKFFLKEDKTLSVFKKPLISLESTWLLQKLFNMLGI